MSANTWILEEHLVTLLHQAKVCDLEEAVCSILFHVSEDSVPAYSLTQMNQPGGLPHLWSASWDHFLHTLYPLPTASQPFQYLYFSPGSCLTFFPDSVVHGHHFLLGPISVAS